MIKITVLKSKIIQLLFITFLTIYTQLSVAAIAPVVGTGTISGMIVPADASITAIVSFNATDPKFLNNCPITRVKFDKTKKELFSFIMAMYLSGKSVAFYYDPNGATLAPIFGHGSDSCELINIWPQ